MPDLHFVFLFIVVLIANAVEAVTGFGSTIIAITLGAHVYDVKHLLYVLVPLNLVLSTYIVVRHRRTINARVLFRSILPLVGLGLLMGRVAFELVNGPALKLSYGAFVLVFSAYEIYRQTRPDSEDEKPPLSGWKAAAWLISGGIMQGIYASGGPMVVYFAGRVLKDKGEFRSTLSSLWLALNIVLTASYAWEGSLSAATIKQSFMLLPALLAGIVLGEALHSRIPERQFRIIVYALLLVAGAALIFNG